MTEEAAKTIAAEAFYKPGVKFNRDSLRAKRIDRDPTDVYWLVRLPIIGFPEDLDPNSEIVRVYESDGRVVIT